MSEVVSPSLLDFHSPRRAPTEALRQLAAWQANVCAQVQDGWAGLLARPVTLKSGKIDSAQYHAALQRLPEDGLGVYFSIGDSLLPSMLVFSARQVQALIADLLDLPGGKWPVPAKLSAAEDAMLELLFQKLAEAIGDGWPEDTPLKCRYLETTSKPHRTRLFPIGSPLFSLKLTIDSRFGEDTCTWLMLKEETERLLLDRLGHESPEDRTAHPDLAALAERVPLDFVVELGKAELSMSQASDLAVGDVLILDQLVTRPLIASLEGLPKWVGMPKRIGSRQAFEVTQVIDSGAMLSTSALNSMES
ncbi:FliM/FliN family flagellar motor switch protein [Planctomicrobium piriforme]|uniref:Flagellar motor switch protein FliM n=1 Tax=Planctomicrobium piriforme TaxID=1576369 RepID=A0A1I3HLI0_9PLAN|nr:FliM/FliN family flagellar motor switch protein [Planctomicrobium piriforme]SFI36638.1 flagellar motor switch protein FliM [Planctomicrobium piriforme]